MSNPWFRLYHEFADDPKVQMLPEAMQRRLIMLFCSRCKGETLHETQRAFHWRISLAELAETKAVFEANGFIDEQWNVLNWNRRQYLSDSSTERVRAFRERKKQDETFLKRNETETVTAPEQIQNRTDTEQKQKKQAASAFVLPNWIPVDAWMDFEQHRKKLRKPMTEKARSLAVGELDRLRDKGHDPRAMIDQAILKGWQTFYEPAHYGGSNGTHRGQLQGNPSPMEQRKIRGQQNLANAWSDAFRNGAHGAPVELDARELPEPGSDARRVPVLDGGLD